MIIIVLIDIVVIRYVVLYCVKMMMSLENNVFYFLNIMVIFLFVFGDSRVDMYFNLVFDGLLIVFSVLVVVINLLVILLFFYREYL